MLFQSKVAEVLVLTEAWGLQPWLWHWIDSSQRVEVNVEVPGLDSWGGDPVCLMMEGEDLHCWSPGACIFLRMLSSA